MKRIGKRIVALVAVAAITITSMVGCGLKDSEVVAKIGDKVLTAGVANFYARFQAAGMETYYGSMMGDNMWTQEYSEGVTYEQEIKNGVMTTLQELYLLDIHAKDYDIKLTDDEMKAIEKAAAAFVKENKDVNLKKVSGNEEVVTEVLRLFTIQSKMREVMTADVDRKVKDKEAAQKSMQYVTVSFSTTDEEGNTTALTDTDKQVLKESVETFARKAKSEKDFEKYAKEKGYEAQVATFDSETTAPAPELIAAADKLKVGETTDLIVTENACYVARVTSKLDREATDAKKEQIIAEREDKAYTELVEEWKKATKIKVYDDVWNKISFMDLKVEVKQEKTEETK